MKPTQSFKLSLAAASVLSLTAMPSQAGFMDEFFNDAGTLTNVQAASINQVQGMRTLSAGGMNVRTRNFDSRLLTVVPPSLKAGCNGIDMVWGSIGFADSEQFIEFIKHVGQNAKVVAFKLALKSLTAPLESTIADVKSNLDWLTNINLDSCQAANRIVGDMYTAAFEQRSSVAAGQEAMASTTPDYSTAWDKFKTNVEYYSGSASAKMKVKSSDGRGGADSTSEESALSRNLTWAALKKAYPMMSKEDKELLMSIAGTVVITVALDERGEKAPPRPTVINPTFTLASLDAVDPGVTVMTNYLRCDEPVDCLAPTKKEEATINFWGKMRTAAYAYREALLTHDRSKVSNDDIALLTATPVPMLDLVSSTSYSAASSISLSLIEPYSRLAALDLAAQMLIRGQTALESAMRASVSSAMTDIDRAQIDQGLADLRNQHARITQVRSTVAQQSLQASQFVDVLKHYRAEFTRKTGERFAANLSFGRR